MKNKMIRNLVVLAAVVLVAIAAAIVLPNIKPPVEATPTPVVADPAQLLLKSYTTDKVNEVTVNNESGSYTVTRKDDVYVIKGKEQDKLDQSLTRDLFYTAGYMVGDQYIGTTDELNAEDFGLAAPKTSIDVTYADGTAATFYLGDKTPEGNAYYIMMKGDKRIVTVWMNYGEAFMRAVDGLYWTQTIDIANTDVQFMQITQRGSAPLTVKKVDPSETIGIYSWMMTSPWNRMCDVEQIDALTTSMIALKLGDVVSAKPGDLAQFGLDDPAYRFIVATSPNEGEGQRYELLVGDDMNDTYAYAKFTNSDVVCTIDKSLYSFVGTYTPFALMDKFLSLVDIQYLSTLTIATPTGTDIITIDHVRQKDENGDPKNDANGNPSYDQVYSLPGSTNLDQKQCVKWYQQCIGLKAHSELEAGYTSTAAPVVTITYKRSRAPEQALIEFLPYDKDFYAVRVDGQLLFRTRIDSVDTLIANFKLLKTGQMPVE